MEDVEIVLGSVRQVGRDHVAYGTVRCAAKTIDLAFQAGLEGENDFAQRFAFNEVVGQLIERPIEIVIRANIAFVCADHDFAVEAVVPVEGKIRPLADKDAIRATARNQFVSNLHCLVEDVVKDLQLRIVNEEEANARFIEDRPDVLLVGAEGGRRRLYLR